MLRLCAADGTEVWLRRRSDTQDFDTFEKLGEYRTVESLRYILLAEPNAPDATVWERTIDRDWVRKPFAGLDARIALPAIDAALILREVHDGVAFPPQPRLVQG